MPHFDNERLSYAEKNANDKQWYRERIDRIDAEGTNNLYNEIDEVSEFKRKKVNYDLINNILNTADFEYVCKPFGAEAGELPAQMINRDIMSSRIKAIEGLEAKRPFKWKAIAINKEATSRREEEEFGRIREFVIGQILAPIREEIELKYQEQLQGGISSEQQDEIKQQIKQEFEAQTPEQVKKYMQRDHQDPAEVLANQLLNKVIVEDDIKRKFSQGLKHGLISAEEIYYVGIQGGKPILRNVNPLRFNYDKSPEEEFIEDGEWATYEFRMSPSAVIQLFGDKLTEKEIDTIYTSAKEYSDNQFVQNLFNFGTHDDPEYDHDTNRVVHAVWKALRKIGFLTYIDENGETQEDIVDENYKLNTDNGDINIDWEWIPEVYEGYKIDSDIYVDMGPVKGQFKDLDNLRVCKLPYVGAVYDNLNSQPTSMVDRMKVYQYYYNIALYRLELLLASDKGKKVLMNINAIPKKAGIDIKKWQYFFESTPIGWFDPNEEGLGYGDVNTLAKEIDLSTAADIAKYIDLARYLEEQCGKSVGVTDPVLGQISASQEVGNTKQAIVQTSHILEPLFQTHNYVKRNVLQTLLETVKVAYTINPPKNLAYVLDDLSLEMIDSDLSLLDNSSIGIYVTDGIADAELMQEMRQLAHAALQTERAEFSDVISIIRQNNSQEAEEILKVAEEKRAAREEQAAELERQHDRKMAQLQEENAEKEHEREIEKIIIKEQEERKTEIQKQAMLSIGFNEDKDVDNDGELDVLEVAKHNVDAQIKARKMDVEEKKLQLSEKQHNDKMQIEKKKLNQPKATPSK